MGSEITKFKPGDRVVAFHEINIPGGSLQNMGLAWGHTTFHIPKKTSFEESSTLPLAFMTVALASYSSLHLPLPFIPQPASPPRTPFLIHSGASAVGANAIELARLSNIHPIIAVSGAGIPFVYTLLDPHKGDKVLDYRDDPKASISGIKETVQKACGAQGKLEHALDAAIYKESWDIVSEAIEEKAAATFILPDHQGQGLPETLATSIKCVSAVHQDKAGLVALSKRLGGALKHGQGDMKMGTKGFGFVWFSLLSRGLEEGWMTGHPFEVVPGELNGLEKAFEDLENGKASALKFVIRGGGDGGGLKWWCDM